MVPWNIFNDPPAPSLEEMREDFSGAVLQVKKP
jgi:hypothetical protein